MKNTEECLSKWQMVTRLWYHSYLKLRRDERFTHAFTECGCVFKEITLIGSNATACSKRTLKTTVATQL